MRPKTIIKEDVLRHAIDLARSLGYTNVTREMLAQRAGISPAQVSVLFGTMPQLRRAIMSAAVARKDLGVIAQGIVAGEPKAKACAVELKLAAVARLV